MPSLLNLTRVGRTGPRSSKPMRPNLLLTTVGLNGHGSNITQTRQQQTQPSVGRDGNYKEKNGDRNDDLPASAQTREMEHPGPPPPNTSETSPNTGAALRTEQQVDPDAIRHVKREHQQQEQQQQQKQREHEIERERAKQEVSSGAKPTLGEQVKDGTSEGVRRHNQEMASRYDRAFNQIGDEGDVNVGFGQKDEKSGGGKG